MLMPKGTSNAEELAAVMKCEHCGMENDDGAHYCGQCGYELVLGPRAPQVAVRSVTPAAGATTPRDP